jgi:catechol 2,3-dioxygenase-like lactoylglutathione lyase family enzyme
MEEPRAVFQQINIVVADMEASVVFYRLLGVEIADTLREWMPHHRSMSSIAPRIDADLDSSTFATKWNEGWLSGRTGVVLAFAVSSRDEVDAVYDNVVAAGYPGRQVPYDAFWGQRYAVVEDPDGLAIGIASPTDDAYRSEPPAP